MFDYLRRLGAAGGFAEVHLREPPGARGRSAAADPVLGAGLVQGGTVRRLRRLLDALGAAGRRSASACSCSACRSISALASRRQSAKWPSAARPPANAARLRAQPVTAPDGAAELRALLRAAFRRSTRCSGAGGALRARARLAAAAGAGRVPPRAGRGPRAPTASRCRCAAATRSCGSSSAAC